MIEHRRVFSSHVESLGYDAATRELHVTYSNGSTAVYEGVDAGVFSAVMSSPSIGMALREHVRGRYGYRYE
jgi:KTSC domain